ncbi:MAG: DUF2164 family protein [Candidatus Sabulitectum sp.]|nr:DUF2164 family protein [Candidatus Sabulitectum sp.]
MNQRLPGDAEISLEERKALIREIAAFFEEQFEQELSEFRAGMILDFFIKKFSPVVYNSAIEDARAFLAESLEEMESTLFAKPSGS